MFTTIGVIVASMPGIAVGLLLAWAIGRNIKARATGKPLPNPITFNPGEFAKAVLAAFTGNADAMRIAFDKSIDIHWKQGDRLSWMMDAVLDEIALNVKDKTFPMPALDALSHWTGIPRDVLFVMGENELRSRKFQPAPPVALPAPAVAAAAMLLCMGLPSVAAAAYPLGPNFNGGPSHWHAQVHAPQRFYPTELNLVAEPKQPLLSDCDLPDPGPDIYVYYFYADWCGDCAKSTQLADELKQKKVNVLKVNAGTDSGARTARTFRVKSVPYWLVYEDGRDMVDTNDPQKVVAYFSDRKPHSHFVSAGVVYGPDGIAYRPPGQPVAYYQASYQQYGNQSGFWQQTAPRRWVSAPVRAGRRVLGFIFRRRC